MMKVKGWGWRVRPLVTLGMALVLAVGNAAAYAAGTGGAAGQLAARPGAAAASQGPQLNQDMSGSLPTPALHETAGDFLGEGHDQIASFKDGNLDISESPKYGGGLKKSTPSDLRETPNGGLGDEGGSDPRWDYVWQGPFGLSAYANWGGEFNFTSVKIASDASNIYMAGGSWDYNERDQFAVPSYRLHLYKLPHDGSCASASCASATTDNLPYVFHGDAGDRLIVVTSLAVGVVGGQTFIAVGLSDDGLYIFNQNLQLVTTIGDMADPGGNQTPVIALAYGPPTGPGQDGLLLGGIETPDNTAYIWHLNPDGSVKSVARSEFTGCGIDLCQIVLSAATAYVNGRLASVFGRSDGDVLVLDPDSAKVIVELPGDQRFGSVTGVTPVTSWDNDPTNQDLAVFNQDDESAEVLHYAGGALTALPIGPGKTTRATNEQVEEWFPGYVAGRLQVVNDSAGPVSVSMASRPDPEYGCWLNASVAQPPVPAFPTEPTTVAAGQSSPAYFIGALTAGVDGSCASAQGNGEWASYVVITPESDPADEHLVKVRVTASGDVEADSQVGGDLTATVGRGSGAGGSWGPWNLTIKGPAAPAALTAPTVTGYQLTSAPGPTWKPPVHSLPDDPCRPVYRFDVSGASWTGVGVPGQVTAQIPAMTAQGSSDGGKTWDDLGDLMPVSAPARSADTVTLGPASFFWQDPPGPGKGRGAAAAPQSRGNQCPGNGGKPLTDVRVESGGLYSNVVHLADLPAPGIDGSSGATPLGSIIATAATGQSATPLANGVDQATLDLTLNSNGGGVIPNDDPRYKLVYYRDAQSEALVTGLYEPGHFAGYIAVGPFEGEYSDTGAAERVHNYLTTTSTGTQSLIADINDTGTDTPFSSGTLGVKGTAVSQLGTAGTAAGGIQVTGCPGACPLAVPADTAPALYQAGPGPAGQPVIGVQFKVEAVTGVASLPLQVGTDNAHTLASAALDIPPPDNKAVLRQTSGFWPTGTIDTSLITSGELVPALSVTVGGS